MPTPSTTIVVGLRTVSSQAFSCLGDVFRPRQNLIIARAARGTTRYAKTLSIPKSGEWNEIGKMLVYVPPVTNNVGQNRSTPGSR